MSTITAILEPQADGTVHVPVPSEMLGSKIRVVATLLPETEVEMPAAPPYSEADRARLLKILEEGRTRKTNGPAMAAALEALAQSDISTRIDLDAWVNELRKDRPLAGRD